MAAVCSPMLSWFDLHISLCELISGYSSSYVGPFVADSWKLGVSHAIEHKLFLMMWVDFVEGWWQNPGGANCGLVNWEYHYQYVANVIENPALMEECMTCVSTRLASNECRYMTYCRLWLEQLLEENGRISAAAKSKQKDGRILAQVLTTPHSRFQRKGWCTGCVIG